MSRLRAIFTCIIFYSYTSGSWIFIEFSMRIIKIIWWCTSMYKCNCITNKQWMYHTYGTNGIQTIHAKKRFEFKANVYLHHFIHSKIKIEKIAHNIWMGNKRTDIRRSRSQFSLLDSLGSTKRKNLWCLSQATSRHKTEAALWANERERKGKHR